MRIHKYLRRSCNVKLQSSSASFPSRTAANAEEKDKRSGRVKDPNPHHKQQNHKEHSWWKQKHRSKPRNHSHSSAKKQQTTQAKPGSKSNRKDGASNDNKNRHHHDSNGAAAENQYPILSLLSPELQQAVQYFGISTKKDFTRAFVKKKYKRLSLVHHPDRNGNEQQSIREMQKINHYFDLLGKEFDRREATNSNAETNPPVTPCSDTTSDSSYSYHSNERKDEENPSKTNPHSSRRRRNRSERRHRRKNTRRSFHRPLETAWGRDLAHNVYEKQVWAYRATVDSMQRDGFSFGEFAFDGKIDIPTKPKHALMESCNEPIVQAMRAGQTKLAIEMVHGEIHSCIQEWIRSKSTKTSELPSAFRKNCKRIILDKECQKQILEVLTHTLDDDGNTILHYAVYLEDHGMISYLAQVARKYTTSFRRFILWTNYRNLMACDYAEGCTWDNRTVPALVTNLTNEAMRKGCQTRKLRLYQYPLVDYLLDIVLCLLMARYVTHTGWVASTLMVALAMLAGADERHLSKSLFFALNMGWYLLSGILSRSKDLFDSFGMWQLNLVCLATVASMVLQTKMIPLACIARAIVDLESALIAGFDWMSGRTRSNDRSSIPVPGTITDVAILSIPFLFVKLLCGAVPSATI